MVYTNDVNHRASPYLATASPSNNKDDKDGLAGLETPIDISVATTHQLKKGRASSFSDLNVDLIEQILIRLPIHSVINCMSVCRQWYSLISGCGFISIHRSYRLEASPPPNAFIILLDKNDIFSFYCYNETLSSLQEFVFPVISKCEDCRCYMIQPLHGLILFGMCASNSFLWNPFVKRYLEIPESRVYVDVDSCVYATMGLGFDYVENDYKIVRMVFRFCNPINCVEAKVYSMKRHSWKELDAKKVMGHVDVDDWSSCFVNGSVHWIAQEKDKNHQEKNFILSFDINNECFKNNVLPGDLTISDKDLKVRETKGLLSIFQPKEWDEEASIFMNVDIWVLNEDNLWTKILNIDFKNLGWHGRVMKLRENGEALIARFPDTRSHDIVDDGNELVSYDTKTTKSKLLFDFRFKTYIQYVGAHCESLDLLDHKDSASLSDPHFNKE